MRPLYLDGSWLAPSFGGTGVRRFSFELIRAMAELVHADAHAAPYVFSIQESIAPSISLQGIIPCVIPINYRRLLYSLALTRAPSVVDRLDPPPAAIHFHDAVRFAPSARRRPTTLVTVHDLAAIRVPGTYSVRARWLRRRSLTRLCDSDALIHTYSESTRNDLLELVRLDSQRVKVVPLGVASAFGERLESARRRELLQPLGIDRPYFLCVGAQHPRKNLPFIIRCFRDVLRGGEDALLALVGPGERRLVDQWCADGGLTSEERARVLFTGPLSDHVLRACYQGCSAFLFPSLYEGFGLPVLEAMASGAPVITTEASSLPEVAGAAAILLPPTAHDDWVEAMRALLGSTSTQRRLAESGRREARRFSWTRAARSLWSILARQDSPGN